MTDTRPDIPRREFLRKAGIATVVANIGSTETETAAAEYKDIR